MKTDSAPAHHEAEDSPEALREKLLRIIEDYEMDLGDEYANYDNAELHGAVYGWLLINGESPEEIFMQRGITENGGGLW